jgi:hypothetical protein
VWSYAAVIVCLPFPTVVIGLLAGASRHPLWLLYFATVLGLCAAALDAFGRIIRQPPSTTEQHESSRSAGH